MAALTAESVAEALTHVGDRIAAAGADPAAVRIVAVTKGFGPDAVAAAVGAGLADVGENFAGELVDKAATAPAGVRWHFLGEVQRNKVKRLAPHVHLWHGVDRAEEGSAIAARAPGASVLVQVNTSGETSKHGCPPAAVGSLVERLVVQGLAVKGLMTIGPLAEPEAARPGFRLLASLGAQLGLPELSMGMSDDLEVAVQEGATTVRVGRALFGPRRTDSQARR